MTLPPLQKQTLQEKERVLKEKLKLRDNPFEPHRKPLVPHIEEKHLDLYVQVDKFSDEIEEYNEFLSMGMTNDGDVKEHILLVRGDGGSGKSSLVNYFLYEINRVYGNRQWVRYNSPKYPSDGFTVVEGLKLIVAEILKELETIADANEINLVRGTDTLMNLNSKSQIIYTGSTMASRLADISDNKPILIVEDIRNSDLLWDVIEMFKNTKWIIIFTTDRKDVYSNFKTRLKEFLNKALELSQINQDDAVLFVKERVEKYRFADNGIDSFFPFTESTIRKLFTTNGAETNFPLRIISIQCFESLERKVIRLIKNPTENVKIDYNFMKESYGVMV